MSDFNLTDDSIRAIGERTLQDIQDELDAARDSIYSAIKIVNGILSNPNYQRAKAVRIACNELLSPLVNRADALGVNISTLETYRRWKRDNLL